MNRIGQLKDGRIFTSAEKALVVMVIAGVFGYWAGFNLSTPGDAVGLPLATASASALPIAVPPIVAPSPQAPRSAPAGGSSLDSSPRDETSSPTL